MCKCRFDAHVMMGLANGQVKQAAARQALAQEMLKVHSAYVRTVMCLNCAVAVVS